MDAMIFFCISMLIGSMLVSAVGEESGYVATHYGRSDADEVLRVFLRATFDSGSLEDSVARDLFRGTEKVADVLLFLALLAADGRLPECHDSVADGLLDAVRSIAHPSLEPHIAVLAMDEGIPMKLLVIENSQMPESGDATAASQRIEGPEAQEMVVVLALSAQCLSHLLGVRPGQSDLRPGVPVTSPQVDELDGHHDHQGQSARIQETPLVIHQVHGDEGEAEEREPIHCVGHPRFGYLYHPQVSTTSGTVQPQGVPRFDPQVLAFGAVEVLHCHTERRTRIYDELGDARHLYAVPTLILVA